MQFISNIKGEPFVLNYAELRTLTGLTIEQALVELQRELDRNAYKKIVGGGKELTDIKPAWLTEELTKVFGLCGIGWYYGFDDPQVSVSVQTAKSGRTYDLWQADILHGWLNYRLVLPDGTLIESEPIYATGGSDNEVKEYAIRGALTNMLGAAASKLCWQLFIYKGEKDNPPKEEKKVEKPDDPRPWYVKALEYGRAHQDIWDAPLGKTDAGQRVVEQLKTMVGAEGWWTSEAHMGKALQAYTGVKSSPLLTWTGFEKLVRVYEGPHAIAGHSISDVMYYHFCKAGEWQKIMAAIPVMEDMELTAEMADALNAILPAFGTFLVKGKGLDTDAIADNLRQHFIKLAEEVTSPTDELVAAVEGEEEIPY